MTEKAINLGRTPGGEHRHVRLCADRAGEQEDGEEEAEEEEEKEKEEEENAGN